MKLNRLKKQRNFHPRLRSSPRGRRRTVNGSKKTAKKTEIDGDIIVPGDNIMLDPGAEDTE